MNNRSRKTLSAALLCGLLAVGAACNNSLGLPPPTLENVVDTLTLFALRGTDITEPSAFDMVNRAGVRTDRGRAFDFAFDIDSTGTPVLFPAGALGLTNEPGLRLSDEPFDLLTKAPQDGYERDSVVTAEPGTVFLARSRVTAENCSFFSSFARFGKFRVMDVDTSNRTMTLELLVNANCGYRELRSGLPDF